MSHFKLLLRLYRVLRDGIDINVAYHVAEMRYGVDALAVCYAFMRANGARQKRLRRAKYQRGNRLRGRCPCVGCQRVYVSRDTRAKIVDDFIRKGG